VDIAVATRDGVRFLSGEHLLKGREIGAMSSHAGALWFVADHRELWRTQQDGEPELIASSPTDVVSLVAGAGVYAGSDPAHLSVVRDGALERVTAFDEVEDRDAWYTPWGGPPAVRSLAQAPGGALLANVHVGGILRSDDGGASWTQTIDIDTDVHQVIAPRDDLALAATGAGFAISRDGARSWTFDDEGLEHTYCRAVALAGDTIVLSASSSHTGRNAALWRRPMSLASPFERCGGGFPDRVGDNIDTFWIAASGGEVVVATPGGEVYRSTDQAATWALEVEGLDGISSVAIA
jgi:hypothetical protein